MEEIIKVYKQRMVIEIIFKDYKKRGYDIEESKASPIRLTNLLLLLAMAYTNKTSKKQTIGNKSALNRSEVKRLYSQYFS